MKLNWNAVGVILALLAVVVSSVWSAATITTEVRLLRLAIEAAEDQHSEDWQWLFEFVMDDRPRP